MSLTKFKSASLKDKLAVQEEAEQALKSAEETPEPKADKVKGRGKKENKKK